MNAEEIATLREVYIHTYREFATNPSTVKDAVDGIKNIRHSREVLGVLVSAGLVAVSDVNGEEDVWQTYPDTYDNMTEAEAFERFDQWIIELGDNPAPVKPDAPKETSVHGCYCGCGENVPAKSFYRPGHDARHAGVIGREIAANYSTPGFDRRELLSALPSDKLVAKAEKIAEKATEKAEAKARNAAAREAAKEAAKAELANRADKPKPAPKPKKSVEPVDGTLTASRKERIARRLSNGNHEWLDDKGNWRKASQAASATFVPETVDA